MRERHLLLLLLFLAALVFLGWQNVVELRGEEPRRAVVSLEMLFSRSFIVPELNGWVYYNKPPLFNWILIGLYQVFQSFEEWVVRLPSLLSCFLLAAGQYWMMRRYYDRQTALAGAFFFLFGAEILLYATPFSGEIDLFFSLLTCLQIWSIYYFLEKDRLWLLFLVSYFFTALGVLTKGLPALPFQAFTLLALFIWKGRWQYLFGIRHIAGILLMAIIVGIYLWAFSREAEVWLFIVRQYKEAAQRTGLENQWLSIFQSGLTVPLELLKLMLPGSLFVFFLLSQKIRRAVFASDYARFCLQFIAVNLPIYWFSGDFKPRYVYMFFPFFCTLFALAAVQGLSQFPKTNRGIHGFWKIVTLIFPLALLGLFAVPEIQDLSFFLLRLGLVLLLAIGVAVLARQQQWWIWSLFFFMVVFRLGFNLFYLPALDQSDSCTHREHCQLVLDLTEASPVYLIGSVYHLKSDASIGPLQLDEVELYLPMVIAYQIPYYLSRGNRQPLRFVEEPVPGAWHLTPGSSEWAQGQDVLVSLPDRTNQKDWVLFKAALQ